MFRWPTLLLAVVLSAPALWSAFGSHSMSVSEALTRFLVAIVVASIMVKILNSVTENYRRGAKKRQLQAIRAAQAAHQARAAQDRQA